MQDCGKLFTNSRTTDTNISKSQTSDITTLIYLTSGGGGSQEDHPTHIGCHSGVFNDESRFSLYLSYNHLHAYAIGIFKSAFMHKRKVLGITVQMVITHFSYAFGVYEWNVEACHGYTSYAICPTSITAARRQQAVLAK